MSNKQNDIIADRIADEVSKIHFVRKEDEVDYSIKWFNAVLESEQPDIFKVKPPVYGIKPMTDEQLKQHEETFINSFRE